MRLVSPIQKCGRFCRISRRLINVDETGGKEKSGVDGAGIACARKAGRFALTLGEVGARKCGFGNRADRFDLMTWQKGGRLYLCRVVQNSAAAGASLEYQFH